MLCFIYKRMCIRKIHTCYLDIWTRNYSFTEYKAAIWKFLNYLDNNLVSIGAENWSFFGVNNSRITVGTLQRDTTDVCCMFLSWYVLGCVKIGARVIDLMFTMKFSTALCESMFNCLLSFVDSFPQMSFFWMSVFCPTLII